MFDLQFYNRHLWCVSLRAIMGLVPRERQGVSDECAAGLTPGTKVGTTTSSQQMEECCYKGDF